MSEVEESYIGLRTQWATFTPKRLDTLRPEAVEHIGKTLQWRAQWYIEDEDSTYYGGQVAWLPADYNDWFGWVPDEDLTPTDQP